MDQELGLIEDGKAPPGLSDLFRGAHSPWQPLEGSSHEGRSPFRSRAQHRSIIPNTPETWTAQVGSKRGLQKASVGARRQCASLASVGALGSAPSTEIPCFLHVFHGSTMFHSFCGLFGSLLVKAAATPRCRQGISLLAEENEALRQELGLQEPRFSTFIFRILQDLSRFPPEGAHAMVFAGLQ